MSRVFAVGDANLDVFTLSNSTPVFGEERNAQDAYCTLGGNAANFAFALSALGENVSLLSAVGRDFAGEFVKRELGRAGVKMSLLKSAATTGVSNILVKTDGERAIISNKGCLQELTCKNIASKLLGQLHRGDIVFFGGYFHLPAFKKGFPGLLRKIKSRGVKVFFDTCFDVYGRWEVKSFLKYVDLLFLNEIELANISSTKNEFAAVKKLFSWGAREIVVKHGKEGARFYSASLFFDEPAIQVRPINTTAAGDFFNAGFVYGLLKGYSEGICLGCGNFAAARKVSSHGYPLLEKRDMEGFLSSQKLVELSKVKGYSQLSRLAASLIVSQIAKNPASVISLAAGRTPIGVYRELVRAFRRKEVDFSRATFIELDELLGGSGKHSFARELGKAFLGRVNFRRENVFLFDTNPLKAKSECARFDKLVERKGLDLVLLGIGKNAHIAYNGPKTSFSSKTHVVKLSPSMLPASVPGFGLDSLKSAITLGIGQIKAAKKIVLVASGKEKAQAIRKTLKGSCTELVPASVLQRHRNSLVIVDKGAAGKLV